MNKPTKTCRFQKLDFGWQCSECGFVYRKPTPKAPVKNCRPDPHNPFIKASQVQAVINSNTIPQTKELGDRVEEALTMVGITSERVSRWIGRPCGCKKRKEKLNNLSRYVKRILKGDDMKQQMEDLIK